MNDAPATPLVSHELEQWLAGDQPKTLRSIVELFGPRSFAVVFVLLMALPALPLPTHWDRTCARQSRRQGATAGALSAPTVMPNN